MNIAHPREEFDAIVIGSGTAGATVARELSRHKKKVLILERGGNAPLKENLMGLATISDEVKLGDKLTTVRALTTGGSSSMYFGVVNYPELDDFRALGLDIASELAEVKRELPIAPLADALVSPQAFRLQESAAALGHSWHKHDMLVDQSKCSGGYSYDAKWKARSYVDDALKDGATLVNRATARKILVDNNRAIGVEYRLQKKFRTETRQAYGARIVLAAGELESPKILRDSGVPGIGSRGFFCNPGYALYGLVPGLNGKDGFVGSMGCTYEDGIELGDANIGQFLHRLMMLGSFKLRHLMAFPNTIGIGVKVKDSLGGELKRDGGFHKQFTAEDSAKLSKGEAAARNILRNAGATHVFNFGISAAGRVGGAVAIQEHVDANLETQFRNLHVCDGSVIPESMRGTPTVTLLCMSKYLARHLVAVI
jgi:hypothetical protein